MHKIRKEAMEMNMKKILILFVVGMMVLGNVSFAAKGGSRMPAAKAPAAVTRPAPAAPSQSAAGTAREYKPSQNASSAKSTPSQNTTTAQKSNNTSSPWGSMFRNVGLLAGGMFLGGMLANLFGMGGGLMSNLLGIVANVFIFAVILMLVMTLWRKVMGSKKTETKNNISYEDREKEPKIIDIKPSAPNSYEKRSKADEYRKK